MAFKKARKIKNMSWEAAAAGAATGVIGMIGQKKRNRRAMDQQKELMGVQFENQQRLNEQGHKLQMETWKKTNYPAQMEMLREAGLNPALMYGNSGGGGTTTGSQGGGSAQGGQAPAQPPMDMQNILMGAQAAKLMAETKKIEGADTDALRQQIAESIARESNLDEDSKLKMAQALKEASQESLNKMNEEFMEMKKNKGATGSVIMDGLTAIGLDPQNNNTDKWIIRGYLLTKFGIQAAGDIKKILGPKTGQEVLDWIFGKNNNGEDLWDQMNKN